VIAGKRILIGLAALTVAACGTGGLTTGEAHDLIAAKFPGSEVTVDSLRETDAGYLVHATAGGYEGQFTIGGDETGWRIDSASADGSGPADLAAWVRASRRTVGNNLVAGRAEATMATMRLAANAVATQRVSDGEYPKSFSAGRDQWGTALVYRLVDGGYELRSVGRDGEPRTRDDIIMVNGQFTQTPGTR